MRELPPSLLRELVNVSNDEIEDGEIILVLKPGMDPDDPDAWARMPLPEMPEPPEPREWVVYADEPPEDALIGTLFADANPTAFVLPDGSREEA